MGAVGLSVLSYFANPHFGNHAYFVYEGRLIVHLPFEWASNEYSHYGEFPIETDSLLGVITYWLPDPSSNTFSMNWRESDWGHSDWWRLWFHPLDTSTDGEFSETEARPIPISLVVYITVPVCIGLRFIPVKKRSVADRGGSALGGGLADQKSGHDPAGT